MRQLLFKPIDNAPLILFRIFFGLLLAIESFGAIATGWVKRVFIDTPFTFSHIGFEWLQPLPGYGMYYYFVVMGCCGIAIMLGFRYRLSMLVFTLLWTSVYLMQKSTYNNHYYLLVLVSIIMLMLPAHRYASLDAKYNPEIRSLSMPQWCSWVMIGQVLIVYTFAAFAKFYPDWLDGTFTRIMLSRNNIAFLTPVTSNHVFHLFIAYSGILFDLLIVPLLLYKKTRTVAFFAALFFHLFNAAFLHIGIFPFFALSFVVFFYPPERIRDLFFKRKPKLDFSEISYSTAPILKWFFIPYFIIQLALPVRHWFIPHDALWTEEGHRLSWRMMLRMRQGYTQFRIIDKATGTIIPYDHGKNLTNSQKSFVGSHPDGIWQMAQIIKKEFAAKNQHVAIYVDSQVSINEGPYHVFINPAVDLASAKWNYFTKNDWITVPAQYQ